MMNVCLTLMRTVVMGDGITAWAVLESGCGEGTVFTTAEQGGEGGEAAVIAWDQLPVAMKDQIPEGTSLVMTSKDQLLEGATYVPAGGDLDAGGWDGIFNTLLAVGGTFVPGLAAWEGVLTLFSQRKRTHYIKAAQALVPTGTNVAIGGHFQACL